MSRRQSEKTDSLEMLLDTMCNAFGGLILIAILIAILAKPPIPEGGDPEVEIVKVQIETLTPEAEDLQAEKEEKTKKVDAIDPAVTNLVQQRLDLNIKIAASTSTLTNLATTPEEKEKMKEKIKVEQAMNEQKIKDLSEAENQLAKIQTQVAQANKGKPVTVRGPRARGIKKKETHIIIKDGQWWAADYFVNGKQKENIIGCRIEMKNGRKWRQVPVPGKGVRIVKDEAQLAQSPIGSFFKIFPRTTHWCYFHVHKNSFAEFRILKEVVLKAGVDYGWGPYTKDEIALYYGAFSGSAQ